MRTSVRLLQNHRGGGHVALPHLLLLLLVLVHLEQDGHMAHPHTAGPLPGHQVVLPLRPLQRGEVVQQPITCRQRESSLCAAMIQRHVFSSASCDNVTRGSKIPSKRSKSIFSAVAGSTVSDQLPPLGLAFAANILLARPPIVATLPHTVLGQNFLPIQTSTQKS